MFVCLIVLKRHFQQYFSYIMAVSFIGGGNRCTRRKPLTCRKSLTNFSFCRSLFVLFFKVIAFSVLLRFVASDFLSTTSIFSCVKYQVNSICTVAVSCQYCSCTRTVLFTCAASVYFDYSPVIYL